MQTDATSRYLIAGIESSRNEIISGHYIANVIIDSIATDYGGPDAASESRTFRYRLMFAFDHSSQHYRLDREYPDYDPTEFSVGINVGQYVRTPSKSIVLHPTDKTISIKGVHRDHSWRDNFDFQSLGLATVGDLTAGRPWDWIWGHVKSMSVDETTSLGEGLYRIRMRRPDSPFIRTLVIDEKRGFWPVEMSLGEDIKSKVEVMQLNGVWVPTLCTCSDRRTKLTITLDWIQVNEPADKRLFDYHSFASAPGTKVLDWRLGEGQPVLVEVLGRKGSDFVPESKWTRNLFLAASIVIVAGSCLFCFRRKTTGKKI